MSHSAGDCTNNHKHLAALVGCGNNTPGIQEETDNNARNCVSANTQCGPSDFVLRPVAAGVRFAVIRAADRPEMHRVPCGWQLAATDSVGPVFQTFGVHSG